MKLILFLIKRLFTSKNSSLVFRLTNFITILSLSLGVASLSIVISSINGFLVGGASQKSHNFIDIIKKTIN